MSDHHGAGHVFFNPDRLADGLLAFTFFGGWDHHSVLVIDFFNDSLTDLASAGLFDPLGDAYVNSSLLGDHFGDADGPLDDFPGACWLAGGGTGRGAGAAGCRAATACLFAEAATGFGGCRYGGDKCHGKNESHSLKLLLTFTHKDQTMRD